MWERCQTSRPIGTKFGTHISGNGNELKINPLIPEGHGELGGHQFINMGKLPNHWTDRDQIWHTYSDSPGNEHRLKKLPPRAPMVIFRGQGVTN